MDVAAGGRANLGGEVVVPSEPLEEPGARALDKMRSLAPPRVVRYRAPLSGIESEARPPGSVVPRS